MQPTTPQIIEEARQQAIDWQAWQAGYSLSYSELLVWQWHFEAVATTYPDLKEEFIENGII